MSSEIYQALQEPRSSRHTIRHIDYHVTEWGDERDPLLVYLHGWSDTGTTFQAVVDALAAQWHVVAPDWRGFGNTGHCANGYWFPDYLADLDALLDLYSQGQPVVLVGHSMGANVAGLYAGVRPERVRALVNVEGFGLAAHCADEAPGHFARWLKSVKRPARTSTWPSYADLEKRIVRRAPRISDSYAAYVAREWASRSADGSITLRADHQHTLPNPVLYRRGEAEACWRRIEADVRIVVGASSGLNEASNLWGELVSNGNKPGAQQRCIIDGVGHMIHFEAPAVLAQQIDAIADI